jgi:predicted transcriptional regulator
MFSQHCQDVFLAKSPHCASPLDTPGAEDGSRGLFLLIELINPQSASLKVTHMTAQTRVLTAHVPLRVAKKVEAMAARLERSRGWVMKQALAAWVDQEEERHRMTLEALADGDAGRVIDQAAVQAWADSLGTDKPLPPPVP